MHKTSDVIIKRKEIITVLVLKGSIYGDGRIKKSGNAEDST